MNIFLMIVFAFEIVVGIASTVYLIVSLFWTLGYKFYRKFRHGISFYN